MASKPAPSSSRRRAKRSGGTAGSPVKRMPSTGQPAATRSLTRARSAGAEVQAGPALAADGEGEGGLAEDGRHDHRVDHQGEREVAGQAHADGADALAAELGVDVAAERAQPVVMGLEAFAARTENSRLTQALVTICTAA